MTTTVYVAEDQRESFEADCNAQKMGFSFGGQMKESFNGQVLNEYHIWHNNPDASQLANYKAMFGDLPYTARVVGSQNNPDEGTREFTVKLE